MEWNPDDIRFRYVRDTSNDRWWIHCLRNANRASRGQGPLLFEQNNDITNNERHQLFIAEINGCAIGTILIQNRDGRMGMGWSVQPDYRGRGLGKLLAMAAVKAFPGPKRAFIRHENKASIACAKAAGYHYMGTDDDGNQIWERE